ncbi:ImmA/IrrE family metallo-endopeptidase [Anaerococcus tetradius]|uniref:Toxin-antitoxin system, toxin component domain protein n=1 Tax=Anaerococcus tetradius TaxID=33036 RepID=A0A133KD48_9FIRM|nr:ImmA/IrrE family metallo-endopeptidase [Anaerococcus tetradius]KWZ77450.1 toxin-antitoxin system, toxin component domain protein [Anaerococcus tetradius]
MDKKVIDKKIENLIKKAGSNDLEDIISYLGIKIIKQPGKSFYCQIRGKKYIYLDTKAPEEIKPFILAHELGHAILHKEEIYHYSPLSINKTSTEREADYFAFKILGKCIDTSLDYTISQYANLLAVSEDTIKYIMD